MATKTTRKPAEKQYELIAINWTEYERGWGQRPDGYTLYLTIEDAKADIARVYESRDDGPVPDEYCNPGQPFRVRVPKDAYALYKKAIQQCKQGIKHAWGDGEWCPYEKTV